MKYIKPFNEEEEDLIDYLQEFFDRYSISKIDVDYDNEEDDKTNNYILYHHQKSIQKGFKKNNRILTISIDIYNDPDSEVYNNLCLIQPNIEKRLGYALEIRLEDYTMTPHSRRGRFNRYNIILCRA